MKTFRYPLGHEARTTMNVSELVKKLSEYPSTMPVLFEWEGIYTAPNSFKTENTDYGFEEDREVCLIIDVNDY